ncbi:unnamed protein product [Ceutorhynchus assimilis]|uniref:Uncharacterized protein n=1 Tax=Ceutorhynchus assimilis TaxID=467358 RepID=A0A9N9MUZ9_9CUCU|nr:unnamed protein product [Ceutorhynchus assimilis]
MSVFFKYLPLIRDPRERLQLIESAREMCIQIYVNLGGDRMIHPDLVEPRARVLLWLELLDIERHVNLGMLPYVGENCNCPVCQRAPPAEPQPTENQPPASIPQAAPSPRNVGSRNPIPEYEEIAEVVPQPSPPLLSRKTFVAPSRRQTRSNSVLTPSAFRIRPATVIPTVTLGPINPYRRSLARAPTPTPRFSVVRREGLRMQLSREATEQSKNPTHSVHTTQRSSSISHDNPAKRKHLETLTDTEQETYKRRESTEFSALREALDLISSLSAELDGNIEQNTTRNIKEIAKKLNKQYSGEAANYGLPEYTLLVAYDESRGTAGPVAAMVVNLSQSASPPSDYFTKVDGEPETFADFIMTACKEFRGKNKAIPGAMIILYRQVGNIKEHEVDVGCPRSLRTYAKNEEKKKIKSGSAGGKVVKWFAFDAISFIPTQDTPNTGLDSENATQMSIFIIVSLTDNNELKKAKGIKKSVVEKHIHLEDYRKVVESGGLIFRKMKTFRSERHDVYTEILNKVALSHYDDKRFIIPNSIKTLPWGHTDIIFHKTEPEQIQQILTSMCEEGLSDQNNPENVLIEPDNIENMLRMCEELLSKDD